MSTNIFVFLLSYFPGSPRLFQLFDVNPLPYYVITQMTPICPRMIALPPRRLPPPFPSGDYAGRKRPLVAWEVSSAARRWGTTGNSEFGVRSSELREDGIARERNCAKTESRENGIALKRRSHRRGRRPRRPPIGLRPLKVNCCAAAREGPLGDPPEGDSPYRPAATSPRGGSKGAALRGRGRGKAHFAYIAILSKQKRKNN